GVLGTPGRNWAREPPSVDVAGRGVAGGRRGRSADRGARAARRDGRRLLHGAARGEVPVLLARHPAAAGRVPRPVGVGAGRGRRCCRGQRDRGRVPPARGRCRRDGYRAPRRVDATVPVRHAAGVGRVITLRRVVITVLLGVALFGFFYAFTRPTDNQQP